MKFTILGLMTFSMMACATAAPTAVPQPAPTPEPTVDAPTVPTDCEKSGAYQPPTPIQLDRLPATKKFCPLIMRVPQEIVDMLESGVKHFEYRKVYPTDPASHIIYFNTTTQELVGYAPIGDTLVGPPAQIAQMTWQQSGATYDELMQYFGPTRAYGYATGLGTYVKLKTPISNDQIVKTMDSDFQSPPKYTFVSRFPKLEAYLKAVIAPATR